MEQQPDTIENIKVVDTITYLGLQIVSKRIYVKTKPHPLSDLII